MLVLDTDTLSIIQRRLGVEYGRLDSRLPADNPQLVFVTIISFEEQCRGWLSYITQAKSKERQIEAYAKFHGMLKDFSGRQILDYGEQAVAIFQHLVQSKVRIGTMDLKIAAIALAHDATLISRNLRDFRKVPGLRVEDWTK